jgi:hypothetical protein
MTRLISASLAAALVLSAPRLSACAPVAPAAAVNITSTDGLIAALQRAKGGETFLLAPGSYSALGGNGWKPASEVVIASADPANQATIAGIEFDDSQNLTFRDLKVTLNARTQTIWDITHSSNILIERVEMYDKPGSSHRGLMFRWAQNVALKDSKIHDNGGVRIIASQHVVVSGGDFRDLSDDGIQTNDSSFVTLKGNHFTDFHPGPGDHPDAMQFETYGQTQPMTDIEVLDNVVERGGGGIVQGVFMGNEAHIPYQRVKIVGNGLAGTMYNGIAIGAASDVEISRNYVLPYVDMGSSIGGGPVVGLTMDENWTAAPIDTEGSTKVRVTNTHKIRPAAVGDASAMRAWVSAQSSR